MEGFPPQLVWIAVLLLVLGVIAGVAISVVAL